ncbi:Retrovirus-related Pol polyprotein from transposon RE1 [Vitis vinifera]|uniref:Retrovirus-related Pol polyprotein from transposon RE1 n=1 Tax=Vitis vinifera TaxID=29760 RepID=A0A438DWK8_VITVI|nr:Retrovirus-related Pol polyprotein from transposon RE1 [Vitis vinifera]
MGGVTSGSLSNMIILVGLKAPVQADTSMEPNVMGDVPTQTLNVSINCATISTGNDKNWLLDSTASHNITCDFSNLSIHSEDDGTNKVILGDGSDKITGAILLKGACNNGIYTFPESLVVSKKVANVHEWTSIDGWHNAQPTAVSSSTVSNAPATSLPLEGSPVIVASFPETFGPVVKPATIKVILSIAIMNEWDLRRLDVNNAFLHGELTAIVFMAQPPGFKDLSKPHHVCRLKKAIYGLKQAPWAWYTTLKTAILQLGFQNSKADSSLFIYSQGSTLCYFLVYVDDFVITGNNPTLVASIIKQLGDMFSLKDIGSLHFFLGIEVIPTKA